MTTIHRASISIAALLLASSLFAADRTLILDPESSTLSFTLDATGHDVEGSLSLSAGSIRFDPERGTVSGEIAVDATKTETGNNKRDKTMHRKVLESVKYPSFVFRPVRFDGALPTSGAGKITLHGSLSIHGGEHRMDLPVTVTVEGDRLSAQTTMSIPFVEWGMEDPSFLFLRVAKRVEVSIELAGTLGPSRPAGDR